MDFKKRKSILRALLAIGTLASLFYVPWPLVWAWILPLPDSIQAQLDEGIDHGFDGMIVYVDQAGKPPEFYSAGWHDRENEIPANPEALFKIASIGKLYHAVAITKLVNTGQLSLDKKLADYLPDLVGRIENSEDISLRMLVQHRSGIPNYTDTPDFWVKPPNSSDEALQRILDLPANFEPGEEYEYSNTNYLLLSQIIEKELGYDSKRYIREAILDPLGLKNTYFSIREINMDDLMSGYYVGVEEDIKSTDYGSMVATAKEVGVFLRALNNGSLFDEGGIEIYSSIYEFNHTGLIPGYQSIAKYHEDIDTVVIQFVNTTNFDGYTWNLSEIVYNRILKILRKE
ncbi:beta-lactamase family protein [Gramella lutea]|uniref:Beta-lactamase family protein n=1 Tax=Christiangramia lutea TaxID=1607951 RepID=A0A9X1V7E4_9FLAO|nr:beta-lactamase family protein [Christiangramia lutea]MCH4824399.1 beta-lactamase family protein [Christiangramia lutea]